MPKSEVLQKINLQEPKMFKVLLLNDEVTTMDFVVEVLMRIFHKNYEDAYKTMLEVHCQGSGVCGIYSQEIALSKQKKVQNMAKMANFPLQTRVEQE